MNGMPLYTLTTRLGPKEADHSYNGIIFDVESKAPYEVVVTAVWVAGMLGNVRAFVRDQPWSGHDLRPKARQSMWGNRYIIEKEGWEQVADVQCSPSWDKCREIIFDEPLRLLPGQVRPSFHPLPLHSLTERSGDKLGVLIDRERWNPAPSSRGRHCISRLQVPHPEGTVTPSTGVKCETPLAQTGAGTPPLDSRQWGNEPRRNHSSTKTPPRLHCIYDVVLVFLAPLRLLPGQVRPSPIHCHRSMRGDDTQRSTLPPRLTLVRFAPSPRLRSGVASTYTATCRTTWASSTRRTAPTSRSRATST